jgi:hypothetical protein
MTAMNTQRGDELKCPKCGTLIPISEALTHQIAERTRSEMSAEIGKMQTLLREKDLEIEKRAASIDQTIADQVAKARTRLQTEAASKAREELAIEMEDLRRIADERKASLEAAGKLELDLRRRQREMEEKEKTRDLEIARTLDEERVKIREAAITDALERHRLKDAEMEKKLQGAMKLNEELNRKLQQGSQQTQGEVLEIDLQASLTSTFPVDKVEEVPKGVSGGDILQHVLSTSGIECGIIIWETKRTKNWSDAWIAKLKDDRRKARADIAVIVSEVLPKDCNHFKEIDGVWVCHPRCAVNLAAALRLLMVQVTQAKNSAIGKSEKMEVLYRYLSGPEFGQRIEAIVDAFKVMQEDLQEEKRVTERRWGKREKQIQSVISNTAGMYGDLQGLIGSSLQNIASLTDQSIEQA